MGVTLSSAPVAFSTTLLAFSSALSASLISFFSPLITSFSSPYDPREIPGRLASDGRRDGRWDRGGSIHLPNMDDLAKVVADPKLLCSRCLLHTAHHTMLTMLATHTSPYSHRTHARVRIGSKWKWTVTQRRRKRLLITTHRPRSLTSVGKP